MGEKDTFVQVDAADVEARKARRTIWVGEGLLWKAQDIAHSALERFRGVTGQSLPPADDRADAPGGDHAG